MTIGLDPRRFQERTKPTMTIARSIVVLACALVGAGQGGGVPEPFAIEVVDADTGRGVPLVELETVNNQRFVTDSNGLAALDGPDLMGQDRLRPRQEPRLRVPQGRLRLSGQGAEGRARGEGTAGAEAGQSSPSGSTGSPAAGSIATRPCSGARPRSASRCSTPRSSAPTAWSRTSTAARSTGSGATRTRRPIRWATSTSPAPPRPCRPTAGSIPGAGSTWSTTSTRRRASPVPRRSCRARARPGSAA